MTNEQFEWIQASIEQLRNDVQQIRERTRELHGVVCNPPEVRKSRHRQAVENEKVRILTQKKGRVV